jgi:hypothetical protein
VAMPTARAIHGDHMTHGRHHTNAMALAVTAGCGVALVPKSDICGGPQAIEGRCNSPFI